MSLNYFVTTILLEFVRFLPVRLLYCRTCKCQVKICPCCDRGNVYCPVCAPIAKKIRIDKAKLRYRQTDNGLQKRSAAEKLRRKRKKKTIISPVGDHGSLSCSVPITTTMAAPIVGAEPKVIRFPKEKFPYAIIFQYIEKIIQETHKKGQTICSICNKVCFPNIRSGIVRWRNEQKSWGNKSGLSNGRPP
jgi:hypothetical protein